MKTTAVSLPAVATLTGLPSRSCRSRALTFCAGAVNAAASNSPSAVASFIAPSLMVAVRGGNLLRLGLGGVRRCLRVAILFRGLELQVDHRIVPCVIDGEHAFWARHLFPVGTDLVVHAR